MAVTGVDTRVKSGVVETLASTDPETNATRTPRYDRYSPLNVKIALQTRVFRKYTQIHKQSTFTSINHKKSISLFNNFKFTKASQILYVSSNTGYMILNIHAHSEIIILAHEA